MASPEDVERAAELAFGLFQIPAAIWYGTQSAFSQVMPLTTKSYSDVFVVTKMYAMIGFFICLLLFGDALIKTLRMFRLMMLGRLRPWGCIRRFMGYTEIRTDPSALHDDVICINVPLTGFAVQIILMLLLDVSLSFFLAIFWIAWIPWVFLMMIVTTRQPKSYYQHMQSIRGKYEGVPRISEKTPSSGINGKHDAAPRSLNDDEETNTDEWEDMDISSIVEKARQLEAKYKLSQNTHTNGSVEKEASEKGKDDSRVYGADEGEEGDRLKK